MPDPIEVSQIPIEFLFLSLDNPRFSAEVPDESQAIQKLCDEESVLELARDIRKFGTNPLERFALLSSGRKTKGPQTYYVAEGNRRLCALKLLNDPDLAPQDIRRQFEALSKTWAKVTHIDGMVFSGKAEVNFWLGRIHKGFQHGIGRKDWTPDQQARLDGDTGSKNWQALQILDHAEKEGMIEAKQRSRRLTTVQRYIGNEAFREALGVVFSEPNLKFTTSIGWAEFNRRLLLFITDLLSGNEVTSRKDNRGLWRKAERRGQKKDQGKSSRRRDKNERIEGTLSAGKNKEVEAG